MGCHLTRDKSYQKRLIIDLASIGLRISARLANKPKQKYVVFTKLSLVLFVACELAKNSHIFLTGANQHIWEIHRHFYGTLNHFGPIVFESNQEKRILKF